MNQEEKCKNGQCFHGDEDHKEGACWKITQEQLKNEKTVDKFCGCLVQGNTRRFDHPKMGFMPVQELGDLMITKECIGCHGIFNMLIKETLCMICKDRPEFWVNIPPTLKEN